ncbi:MAG: Cell division protein ftsA [Candidatus Woesebacteria bacterium GW2011_GWB1_44_11]|uniref:Cell division protein FtsA n=2 Tax=Candidatus Woeseibacteriota TaxID=1752722 RepID=A0A837I8X6_9BACT|nr:MAG: Cell division protein ftsA [Candidatus Woesebacteria bacterium GW2011_GWB1_44_11]KKT54151.1 MAG: Cell division protein ftsA [Candidatus Woesebacteria bacterium GW2011_GWA1_44_23]OGM76572.1 MAG: cell division protein FtsA [Candidatus Woesebacteria bacterium RIFOXYA1_FULL_43_16]
MTKPTKSRIVAAIDIGSSKIATLVSQVAQDPVTGETSVNVVGAATSESRGIKKGQIVDIEEAVEATISSVEAAERMAGYNLESVFVALGGAHIHSQNSHGVVAVSDPSGEITQNDIDRAIEAASAVSLPTSREAIHILPREFIVDGEAGVRDAVGMSGVRLEVDTHIISAASAAVKNIKKAVNEVGVEIEDLVFSGLASAESVLSPTEKELGCVLVDIGGGTTSIAVFIDGALAYSGVIPVGAKNVTNDLAIGLRVSLEAAEKIKIALSSKKPKDKEEDDEMDLERLGISEIRKISKKTLLEGIMRPRLNEIFTMVRIELEREGLANRVPSGAIVTGGGAETAGVVESARRMLSLPVRIGVPGGVGGLIDDIMQPSFASSVGLLLYGAREMPKESLTSFTKKMKLPSAGVFGKLIDNIKNLLP